MPRKKKVTEEGAPIQKNKSLFDHINAIRTSRDPNYFKNLTDADRKTWSNYMICRFLSMQPDLIETINDIQYYQDKLSPEHFYRLCLAVVPNRRGYWPYIKNQSEKYDKMLLTLLCFHFQECERNVMEYISLLSRDELRKILGLYGYSDEASEKILTG